jgi:hypothetical protein
VKATTARVYPRVSVDGSGVVSHAGTALLRELADRVGLRAEFAVAVDGTRCRAGGHDPGQVLVDLAVMLADGREAIRDRAWLARGEVTGRELPAARAAGKDLDYVVIDLDATLIEVHSEKEQAAPTSSRHSATTRCAVRR